MLCSFARVIPRSVAFVVPGLQGDIPYGRIRRSMRKTSMVIGLFIALLTLSPKVDAGEQPHFHGKTITLLRVAKDPAFRKDWEDVVLEGSAFEQMFTGKEVFEDVKLYTDWCPEIMSMYKRLAHEAPK